MSNRPPERGNSQPLNPAGLRTTTTPAGVQPPRQAQAGMLHTWVQAPVTGMGVPMPGMFAAPSPRGGMFGLQLTPTSAGASAVPDAPQLMFPPSGYGYPQPPPMFYPPTPFSPHNSVSVPLPHGQQQQALQLQQLQLQQLQFQQQLGPVQPEQHLVIHPMHASFTPAPTTWYTQTSTAPPGATFSPIENSAGLVPPSSAPSEKSKQRRGTKEATGRQLQHQRQSASSANNCDEEEEDFAGFRDDDYPSASGRMTGEDNHSAQSGFASSTRSASSSSAMRKRQSPAADDKARRKTKRPSFDEYEEAVRSTSRRRSLDDGATASKGKRGSANAAVAASRRYSMSGKSSNSSSGRKPRKSVSSEESDSDEPQRRPGQRRGGPRNRVGFNGDKRLPMDFANYGNLTLLEGATCVPRVKGRGVVPNGLEGSFDMYKENWHFKVEYASVGENEQRRPVTCVRYSVRNDAWDDHDFVTRTETPDDATKRETKGSTLCNKLFSEAMERRAKDYDKLAETEAGQPDPSEEEINKFERIAQYLRPEKFSEGPLLFGLRHKAVQDRHNNVLVPAHQGVAPPGGGENEVDGHDEDDSEHSDGDAMEHEEEKDD